MPKSNSPCVLLALIYLGVAAYNYWTQGLTIHNIELLAAAGIINLIYVANRTVGIILPAVIGYQFAQHGYPQDGVLLFILSITSIVLDYCVIEKEKE